MSDERLQVPQQLSNGVKIVILDYTDQLMESRLAFDAGASVPLHEHPEAEMNFVISGRYACTLDNTVRLLGPGQSVLVRGGRKHSLRALEAGSVLTVWGPVRRDLLELFVHGRGRPVLEP